MSSTKEALRMFALALLMMSGSALLVLAQEQPPAPKQNPTAAEAERAVPGRELGHENREPAGPARQLAHQSREAAGEEKDEMEEFKRSPSVSWVAEKLHISLQTSYWLSILLNFVVIGAAMVWAGRKYLPGIFRDRTAAIQKAMQEAQKASEEARRKLAEIEARLQKLDVEIGMMRDAAEREGAAEEARIQAAAQEDARKIVASAEQEISAAAKAARRQLTAHAADLAVGLARKQIHVDAATDHALVRNFSGQLGSAENSGKDGN
jgi:F-type H+-transporting ATPase subunit b